MAKKRVHEIAKERGIPSKEVIARLQAAGFDVKAAASSVDERDIAVAFSGGTRERAAAPQATAAPRPSRRLAPRKRPRPGPTGTARVPRANPPRTAGRRASGPRGRAAADGSASRRPGAVAGVS